MYDVEFRLICWYTVASINTSLEVGKLPESNKKVTEVQGLPSDPLLVRIPSVNGAHDPVIDGAWIVTTGKETMTGKSIAVDEPPLQIIVLLRKQTTLLSNVTVLATGNTDGSAPTNEFIFILIAVFGIKDKTQSYGYPTLAKICPGMLVLTSASHGVETDKSITELFEFSIRNWESNNSTILLSDPDKVAVSKIGPVEGTITGINVGINVVVVDAIVDNDWVGSVTVAIGSGIWYATNEELALKYVVSIWDWK